MVGLAFSLSHDALLQRACPPLSQETARDSLETTERQPGDTEFAGGYAVRHSALGDTLQKDREFHRAVRRLAVNCNKQTSRCFSPKGRETHSCKGDKDARDCAPSAAVATICP